jgi:predicted Zn-dependent peptidase
MDEIWSVIRRELDALIGSVTQDDLTRLVNKIATAATVGGERPGDRMQRLGRQWTYLGEYSSLEDELAKIQAVTLDDLHAVHEAFPFTPVTVGRLGPA